MDASIGISIREGFLITILGKPNTGKSSFINKISGKDHFNSYRSAWNN